MEEVALMMTVVQSVDEAIGRPTPLSESSTAGQRSPLGIWALLVMVLCRFLTRHISLSLSHAHAAAVTLDQPPPRRLSFSNVEKRGKTSTQTPPHSSQIFIDYIYIHTHTHTLPRPSSIPHLDPLLFSRLPHSPLGPPNDNGTARLVTLRSGPLH